MRSGRAEENLTWDILLYSECSQQISLKYFHSNISINVKTFDAIFSVKQVITIWYTKFTMKGVHNIILKGVNIWIFFVNQCIKHNALQPCAHNFLIFSLMQQP